MGRFAVRLSVTIIWLQYSRYKDSINKDSIHANMSVTQRDRKPYYYDRFRNSPLDIIRGVAVGTLYSKRSFWIDYSRICGPVEWRSCRLMFACIFIDLYILYAAKLQPNNSATQSDRKSGHDRFRSSSLDMIRRRRSRCMHATEAAQQADWFNRNHRQCIRATNSSLHSSALCALLLQAIANLQLHRKSDHVQIGSSSLDTTCRGHAAATPTFTQGNSTAHGTCQFCRSRTPKLIGAYGGISF